MKSWHKIKHCPPCLHQTASSFCLWAFVKQILIQLAGAEWQWNLAKTFYICLVGLDEHPLKFWNINWTRSLLSYFLKSVWQSLNLYMLITDIEKYHYVTGR